MSVLILNMLLRCYVLVIVLLMNQCTVVPEKNVRRVGVLILYKSPYVMMLEEFVVVRVMAVRVGSCLSPVVLVKYAVMNARGSRSHVLGLEEPVAVRILAVRVIV